MDWRIWIVIIDGYVSSVLRNISNKYYREISKDLDVRESSKTKLTLAINCFVMNTYRCVVSGCDKYMITLRKESYCKDVIVNGNKPKSRKVSYTYMLKVFHWFVDNKGCSLTVGGGVEEVDKNTGEIVRSGSFFHVGEQVVEDLRKYAGEGFMKLQNVIELRDGNKNPVVFGANNFSRDVIRAMNRYNTNSRKFTVATSDNIVYDVQAKRIFNESFGEGGRMYLNNGSVQSLDRDQRPKLTIDGQPTVELDYKALHPSMLYEMEGLKMKCSDPYGIVLEGYDKGLLRSICKIALLVVFNAKGFQQARKAVNNEIAALNIDKHHMEGKCPERIDVTKILNKLKQLHKPIEKYFYSGVGRELQRKDSDIMQYICDVFVQRGLLAIPIHDSIVVTEDCEQFGIQTMENAYSVVMGSGMNCKIERK